MKTKMILTIVFIVLVLCIGYASFNASKLMTIDIKETVVIKGVMDKVFDEVKYFENFLNWSPFLAKDPTQQISVTGQDGTVGAQYHWEGNKGKDLGLQEIKEIQEGRYIKMQCDIL